MAVNYFGIFITYLKMIVNTMISNSMVIYRDILTLAKVNTALNGTARNRHQCRKIAVLSCHRFLINSGVEKMNYI